MPINDCDPCSSQCINSAWTNNDTFKDTVLKILCGLLKTQSPTAITRINGTYTGTNQEVLAAPGAGFKIRVRSLYAQTEDANTDVQLNSRTGGGVNTAVGPNLDFLSNAGAVLPVNADGWFECGDNCSLVVTTTGGAVDLLGTAIIVPV